MSFLIFSTDLSTINLRIAFEAGRDEDLLLQSDRLGFLGFEEFQRLRRVIMLQFGSVDHPVVNAGLKLADWDSWFALGLTEEVISLPILIWALVAWSSAVALAYKRFADFFVLICFVASLGVANSSKLVEVLEVFLELLLGPASLVVEKVGQELLDLVQGLLRVIGRKNLTVLASSEGVGEQHFLQLLRAQLFARGVV